MFRNRNGSGESQPVKRHRREGDMLALQGRANYARRFTQLLGTASLLVIAQAVGAGGYAQGQQMAAAPESVPEQVLITGSLIRGTVAVGAPVTTLSTQDFAQAGV